MCFWWTNNKIKLNNNLDIMSTIVNKNVKLDTKISVPNNFVGLVYYNDRYLFTLQEGEYKFQGDTFYKVVEKNARRNKNIKKPSYIFNLHYVNISRQKIETSINIQVAFKHKECFVLSCIYEINSPTKFADEILTTWYKTTNKRTEKIVKELFGEFCFEFLRKRLKKNIDLNSQLKVTAQKHFKNYGINICEINLTKYNENGKVVNFFEDNSNSHVPYINPNSNNNSNQIESNETRPSIPSLQQDGFSTLTTVKKYCPNCQAERIEDADFCHKCGYRFF